MTTPADFSQRAKARDALLVAADVLATDPVAAIELFKVAVSLDGDNVAAWQGLAISAAKTGERQLATHAATRAATLGNDVVSFCLLAEIAWQQLDAIGAVSAIKRCLALDPNATHPHGVRARGLLFQIEQKLGSEG